MSKHAEIMIADGSYHDAFNPKPESFTLENIAIALGNTCRWGGHLGGLTPLTQAKGFYDAGPFPLKDRKRILRLQPLYYSVAEHSVLGARYYLSIGETKLAKLFLFHDAAEPFIGGDIPTPLKDHLGEVHKWEVLIQRQLINAYSLEGSFFEIKEVDTRITRNEVICLYNDKPEWSKNIEPLYYTKGWDKTLIRCEQWDNVRAANEWYTLAKELGMENKYVG